MGALAELLKKKGGKATEDSPLRALLARKQTKPQPSAKPAWMAALQAPAPATEKAMNLARRGGVQAVAATETAMQPKPQETAPLWQQELTRVPEPQVAAAQNIAAALKSGEGQKAALLSAASGIPLNSPEVSQAYDSIISPILMPWELADVAMGKIAEGGGDIGAQIARAKGGAEPPLEILGDPEKLKQWHAGKPVKGTEPTGLEKNLRTVGEYVPATVALLAGGPMAKAVQLGFGQSVVRHPEAFVADVYERWSDPVKSWNEGKAAAMLFDLGIAVAGARHAAKGIEGFAKAKADAPVLAAMEEIVAKPPVPRGPGDVTATLEAAAKAKRQVGVEPKVPVVEPISVRLNEPHISPTLGEIVPTKTQGGKLVVRTPDGKFKVVTAEEWDGVPAAEVPAKPPTAPVETPVTAEPPTPTPAAKEAPSFVLAPPGADASAYPYEYLRTLWREGMDVPISSLDDWTTRHETILRSLYPEDSGLSPNQLYRAHERDFYVQLGARHKAAVESAVAQGKIGEGIRDYPELMEKYGTPPAEPVVSAERAASTETPGIGGFTPSQMNARYEEAIGTLHRPLTPEGLQRQPDAQIAKLARIYSNSPTEEVFRARTQEGFARDLKSGNKAVRDTIRSYIDELAAKYGTPEAPKPVSLTPEPRAGEVVPEEEMPHFDSPLVNALREQTGVVPDIVPGSIGQWLLPDGTLTNELKLAGQGSHVKSASDAAKSAGITVANEQAAYNQVMDEGVMRLIANDREIAVQGSGVPSRAQVDVILRAVKEHDLPVMFHFDNPKIPGATLSGQTTREFTEAVRRMREEWTPAPTPAPTLEPTAEAFGSSNTVFSADEHAANLARLAEKYKTERGSGPDTEYLELAVKIGGYYAEGMVRAGAKKINEEEWRKKVLEGAGPAADAIKPYMAQAWRAAQAQSRSAGQGPPPIAAKVPATPEPTGTHAARTEMIQQERAARGLAPVERGVVRTFAEMHSKGQRLVDSGKIEPVSLAADLVRKPRPLSADEEAALLYHKVQIKATRRITETRAAEAQGKDPLAYEYARAEMDHLDELWHTNDQASVKAGTEMGQALGIRKLITKEDYSLEAVLNRKRIRENRPLTRAEQDRVTTLGTRLDDLQRRYDALEARRQTAQPAKTSGPRQLGSTNKVYTVAVAEAARQVLAKERNLLSSQTGAFGFLKGKGKPFRPAPSAEYLRACRDLGGFYVEAGVRGIGKWSKMMIEEAGEAIRPHLQAIYREVANDQRLAAAKKRLVGRLGQIEEAQAAGQAIPKPPKPVYDREVFELRGQVAQAKADLDAYVNPRPVATAWKHVTEVLNIPRALKTMGDFGHFIRQGGFLFGEPKQWSRAARDSVRAYVSEKNSYAFQEARRSHPEYGTAKSAGLYEAPLETVANVASRQEEFIAGLTSKIPPVRWGERAYAEFGNGLRFETFYKYREIFGDAQPPEFYTQLAKFLNRATGRGHLGSLEPMAGELAAGIFAPRFWASRLQAPLYLFAKNPALRKIAAKNMAAYVGVGMGFLLALRSGGAEVETDYRSSNFGKAKIGNLRLNLWGGMLPHVRTLLQFATGESAGGKTQRSRIIARYVRSRLSPASGLAWDWTTGKTYEGEPVEATSEYAGKTAQDLVTPLFAQDFLDAWKDRGPWHAVPLGAASFMGVDVQTYRSRYDEFDTIGKSPAGAELRRLKINIGLPQAKVKIGEREIKLTDAQTQKLDKVTTQTIRDWVKQYMAEASYKSRDDAYRQKLMEKVVQVARQNARDQFKARFIGKETTP